MNHLLLRMELNSRSASSIRFYRERGREIIGRGGGEEERRRVE